MNSILIGCVLLLDAKAGQSISQIQDLHLKANGPGFKVYTCTGKVRDRAVRGLVIDSSRPLREWVRR